VDLRPAPCWARMERADATGRGACRWFCLERQDLPSLSKVAFAITGTRWNGPKFFGLRDQPSKGSSP